MLVHATHKEHGSFLEYDIDVLEQLHPPTREVQGAESPALVVDLYSGHSLGTRLYGHVIIV